MTRRTRLIVAASLAALLIVSLVFVLTRPLRRRLPLRVPTAPAVPATTPGTPLANLPQERWTARLITLEDAEDWTTLDRELTDLQRRFPQLFEQNQLRYFHGRVKEEMEEYGAAKTLLQPYLQQGNAFRDLALYHAAEMATEEGQLNVAAGYREDLILNYTKSVYRGEAIEEHVTALRAAGDPQRFADFASRIRPGVEPAVQRSIDARLVDLLASRGRLTEARERGVQLLRGAIADDAAEVVFRALDRRDIVRSLTPEQLALLGETAQSHRHFDRAVALLSAARARLPKKADDLTFAIGRSFFGNERYEDAEKTYLQGAATAKTPEMKATFFYHASRCAQLLGDDRRAETLMTQAIAVPGRFPSTSAALTQRLRTRAHHQRFAEAASDLRQIRQLFPDQRPIAEASLALATSWIGAARFDSATRELNAIPPRTLESYDHPEIRYWQARALEKSDPAKALEFYLRVLRSDVPTHFAYFARERVRGVFKEDAAREIERLRGEVQQALAKREMDRARRLQTDIVLLAPNDARELETLRDIYRQIPAYAEVQDLTLRVLPAFPLPPGAPRGDLLFAMGLFDETVNEIDDRFPLTSLDSAFMAAHAYNLAGASRESLRAVEILIKRIPDDFVPELLPRRVRELLYPRYFLAFILEDSEEYDADPVLVLSIMREESRFNPRAKSVAAARGLLQFILTTALQIGRDLGIRDLSSEDLYDPRIVIQLGAKYIGDLLEQFNRNPYQVAAAYNAGPNQAKLWGRLAPAAGNDFYLSAINFDETKGYVRKVMNSYQRYREIYEGGHAGGGMRAEP